MSNNVMRDYVFRTNGELYIGVVSAVRSGKSTFIRKFIENKVCPYVDNEELKNKLIDDLPQSSEGKTIMTVEPKFVPSNPVYINIDNDICLNVRLVDCVGYIIPSAKGYINDDGTPRLVQTPWKVESIPFEEAANLGTKKVITNHSHIGILLTSDGSFGQFTRNEYQEIEEKLVEELKELDKPFVIVLNTTMPNDENTKSLVMMMEEKYQVSVVAVDVVNMNESDIDKILTEALNEFDINKLDINVPNWLKELDDSLDVKKEFVSLLDQVTVDFRKFKHVNNIKESLSESRLFDEVIISNLDSGTGEIVIDITCKDGLYEEILASLVGDIIEDKNKFMKFVQESVQNNKKYSQYIEAIECANKTGYGIAQPLIEDMTLDTPEVVKQGSRYGIKLRAIAPSIHMIKVEVESTFEPMIGSQEQSKMLVDSITEDAKDDPQKIWDSTIFGRKLSEVVNDGIKAKLYLLNDTTQYKFRESLEKVVNKNKGGLLTIIL